MAKTNLSTINSGHQAVTTINENFEEVASELQNKVLYRDNPTGEPNSMQNDLDMNSNDILNVGTIDATDLTIAGTDFATELSGAVTDAQGYATDASTSATEAAASATEASGYADDAETSYQNALTVSNTGLDSATSFFDFGLIVDPIVTFPTDYGSVV